MSFKKNTDALKITIDWDTFQKLKERAAKEHQPVATMARILVTQGLAQANESGANKAEYLTANKIAVRERRGGAGIEPMERE